MSSIWMCREVNISVKNWLNDGQYIESLKLDVCPVVEGGHRAIIFSRIGGMQMDTVLSEGLHFR